MNKLLATVKGRIATRVINFVPRILHPKFNYLISNGNVEVTSHVCTCKLMHIIVFDEAAVSCHIIMREASCLSSVVS